MSQRELRSLATTVTPLTKSRLRSGKFSMEGQLKEKLAQLEAELAGAKTALQAKDHEIEQLREKAEEATSNALAIQTELKEQSQEVSALKQELENSRLRAEVDKMHALENLREEHRKDLVREKEQVDFERKRAEEWVHDLRDSFNREKTQLEERVSTLEKALERPRGTTDGGVAPESDEHAPPTTAESATTGGGDGPPPDDGSTTETAADHTESATESSSEASHSVLLEKVTRLLQAQTEAMTAQAQAAAVQHLPAFHCYTGEDDQTDDEVFNRWLERFEERAKLAGWSSEQKLYHLKLHLDKTALQVFRMLPEAERKSYDEAIKALKKRFCPVDIEELRGLEFHTRVQGDESIEQLGIDIQKLGHKAFPTMKGKEFDRIIKGRFFQALHVKWQRKLEAPRPTESFSELYDRARMLERHEKQYAASAAARGDTRNTGKKDDQQQLQQKQQSVPRNLGKPKPQTAKGQNESKPVVEQPSKPVSTQKRVFHGIYHRCEQYGHSARNCPGPPSGRSAYEAHGRSTTETTSRTSAVESNPKPEELTEEQLEDLLSQRRLQREQALLSDSTSTASSVTASEKDSRAVGPTVYIDLLINGEPVRAMVDTGAQSTIISRSMLHAIGCRAKSEGHPLPVLVQPSVRLYGKDGKGGGRELMITAELQVTLEADCKSTCVSVFVQPNSEQKCLLGMNAIPSLGISVLRANGEPLISACEPSTPKVANGLFRLMGIHPHGGVNFDLPPRKPNYWTLPLKNQL